MVGHHERPHSYIVKTPTGVVFRQNRVQLKSTPTLPTTECEKEVVLPQSKDISVLQEENQPALPPTNAVEPLAAIPCRLR